MKVALLTTDNREDRKDYLAPVPWFGTAPEALLQGFASLPEVELHVLSCARAQMTSSEKLVPNTSFHSLYVPGSGWLRTAYQGCIRAVRTKLKEIQPEIVHGQGTERDCAISAVFSGFPSVLTLHGNMRCIARVTKARAFSSFGWRRGWKALRFARPRGHLPYASHAAGGRELGPAHLGSAERGGCGLFRDQRTAAAGCAAPDSMRGGYLRAQEPERLDSSARSLSRQPGIESDLSG